MDLNTNAIAANLIDEATAVTPTTGLDLSETLFSGYNQPQGSSIVASDIESLLNRFDFSGFEGGNAAMSVLFDQLNQPNENLAPPEALPAQDEVGREPTTQFAESPNSEFVNDVLDLTNQFRAENGLPALSVNAELQAAAQEHSEDMAQSDFFDHTNLEGETPFDRIREEGYEGRAIGENIASGQITPEEVVQAWIDSPGHRENLLRSQWEEIGIGFVELEDDQGDFNGRTYWTQNFGSGEPTA